MAEPFLGEIRMFGGNYAPAGWALCDGTTLAIAQNTALFALIGTTYGGDGTTTFNLPDLRGRVPVHMGQGPGLSNYGLGQAGGLERVTLTAGNTAVHNHQAYGSSNAADKAQPTNNVWADNPKIDQFAAGDSYNAIMGAGLAAESGGSQPHDNMQPYQAVNFIIAMQGIFPSQT